MKNLIVFFIFFAVSFVASSQPPSTTNTDIKCFVGFAAGNHVQYVTGDELDCHGRCANLTLNVGNSPMSIFFCDSENICGNFYLENNCTIVYSGLSMCCCEDDTYCNVKPSFKPITPIIDTTAIPSAIIECFIGFDLSYISATTTPSSSMQTRELFGQYSACQGDCANISLNAYGNLYLCDPIQLCTTLQMTNSCSLVDQLLTGCCCSEAKCNYLKDVTTVPSPIIKDTPNSKAQKTNLICWFLIFIFFISK